MRKTRSEIVADAKRRQLALHEAFVASMKAAEWRITPATRRAAKKLYDAGKVPADGVRISRPGGRKYGGGWLTVIE